MNPVRVLFDLCSGFGVGDAVQTSILWKHLRKHRPWWSVGVRAPGLFAGAIAPFVDRFWPAEGPDPEGGYDLVQELAWVDLFATFADRPSTKVAFALKFMFGIDEYDPGLGRYEVRAEESPAAPTLLPGSVAVHFSGSSRREAKDLPPADVSRLWRFSVENRVPFADVNMMPSVKGVGQLASVIGRVAAFVGIDSGPGKVASATDTPTLICWTGHHPLRYHDPAPNTTHLMPEGWGKNLEPFHGAVCDGSLFCEMYKYFTTNYSYLTYRPGELANEACRWLGGVLQRAT